MRHRKKGKILGRKIGPRRALVKGLAQSLVLYEKIQTTLAKAQTVRPYVERLVTLAKEPTLTHRRQLLTKLPTEGAVRKLIEVLGPRYKDRKGGYTRMVKLGRRQGDQAEVALVEFV
jgi:large subunit ribosomal protein L17